MRSPTIDALARDGLQLGRHYAYKVCCPTRSAFISGRLPIHVNVNNANGVAELNGVDIRMTTIAEKLKQGGYSTHAAGKWHAGAHLYGQLPLQRGFDSFVGFLRGWENHFTQQQVTHTGHRGKALLDYGASCCFMDVACAETLISITPGLELKPLPAPMRIRLGDNRLHAVELESSLRIGSQDS